MQIKVVAVYKKDEKRLFVFAVCVLFYALTCRRVGRYLGRDAVYRRPGLQRSVRQQDPPPGPVQTALYCTACRAQQKYQIQL